MLGLEHVGFSLPPPCYRDRPCNSGVSTPPHLLIARAPSPLSRAAVSETSWPKFGMICILSDVGDCTQLANAVYPAYGGTTWPDCPSVSGFSFPCF